MSRYYTLIVEKSSLLGRLIMDRDIWLRTRQNNSPCMYSQINWISHLMNSTVHWIRQTLAGKYILLTVPYVTSLESVLLPWMIFQLPDQSLKVVWALSLAVENIRHRWHNTLACWIRTNNCDRAATCTQTYIHADIRTHTHIYTYTYTYTQSRTQTPRKWIRQHCNHEILCLPKHLCLSCYSAQITVDNFRCAHVIWCERNDKGRMNHVEWDKTIDQFVRE